MYPNCLLPWNSVCISPLSLGRFSSKWPECESTIFYRRLAPHLQIPGHTGSSPHALPIVLTILGSTCLQHLCLIYGCINEYSPWITWSSLPSSLVEVTTREETSPPPRVFAFSIFGSDCHVFFSPLGIGTLLTLTILHQMRHNVIKIWRSVSMSAGSSPKVGWKWKWSNGVGKSEMSIIWCISITNNVKSNKKITETAQTAKFTDFPLISCGNGP